MAERFALIAIPKELEPLWLLIPAYNAGHYLPKLLADAGHYIPRNRIIVVDDGSTDDTSAASKRAEVVLLRNSLNQGKGAALRQGFKYIISNCGSSVITMDADLQHPPKCIPDFIQKAASSGSDLVIGHRIIRGTDMPLDRRFSNWMTSRILSWVSGKQINDAQCGYRLIRTELLKRIHLTTRHFDTETELILKAARINARIEWLMIPTIYRYEKSSIHRLEDTARFLKVVGRNLFIRRQGDDAA